MPQDDSIVQTCIDFLLYSWIVLLKICSWFRPCALCAIYSCIIMIVAKILCLLWLWLWLTCFLRTLQALIMFQDVFILCNCASRIPFTLDLALGSAEDMHDNSKFILHWCCTFLWKVKYSMLGDLISYRILPKHWLVSLVHILLIWKPPLHVAYDQL